MYIAKVLSNLGAWDSLKEKHQDALKEIENVIESIHPQWKKAIYGELKLGDRFISSPNLSKQFGDQLGQLGWSRKKIRIGTNAGSGISTIDGIKDRLGLEYLFGKFAFAESDIFVKFPIFIEEGVIDIAIIIMPVKALSNQMFGGTGIVNLEMVENRLVKISAQLPRYPFVIIGVSQAPSNIEVEEIVPPHADLPEQQLRVFLCHSSSDKPIVRELYQRLNAKKGIDPWLDEVKLLPGVEWDAEITKAVKESDVVIVCLSQSSINKEGYVQKEIRRALDIAEEKPDGTIFIIPLKLEECTVPDRLSKWQWVNYFENGSFDRLINSLKKRAESKGIKIE
jgi:hypothetical protein